MPGELTTYTPPACYQLANFYPFQPPLKPGRGYRCAQVGQTVMRVCMGYYFGPSVRAMGLTLCDVTVLVPRLTQDVTALVPRLTQDGCADVTVTSGTDEKSLPQLFLISSC
ncbi:hypothetical protein Bbelb_166910 [Branchiostoma belcheri]|nr:hypothetical protein Bbelb_166910 [Branchiostoma belcheri]